MEKKNKLSEIVSSKIRQEIKDGSFAVGDKIPAEPILMERYGVGRSTIREAVKLLTLSGILTVQQGAGTIVNEISSEPLEQRLRSSNFADINYVRGILEKEIVGLAVLNRNEAHLNEIAHALAAREEAIQKNSQQACIKADIEFHIAIAKASANTVLLDLYTSFTHIIRDFFSRREPQGITHFAMSHHLHQDLYREIKNKNQKKALSIVSNILNNNH